MKKFLLVALPLVVAAAAAAGACSRSAGTGQEQLLEIAEARGLSPDDARRAVKTFIPPGGRDEFMLFASGGHSGQVHVLGVPSMRLLKTIAVFTPEPWQGYGYGADWSEMALAAGNGNGHAANGNGDPAAGGKDKDPLRWGDSHHPALSETDGKYDGRWLYINDRAHGRIGFVDLGDFRAKQIVQVPNLMTSHGGIFATPNTEYVHISSKVPALKGWNGKTGAGVTLDQHLNGYADIYRGYSTFMKVDPQSGRLDLARSFQIELPPYTQDLADSGKGASSGYAFINSYNVEMATGGTAHGRPPLEVGASQLDFDYLHIINWQKAEQVVAAGKYTELNGIRVISLETAIAEGLLHLAPEPRSPHGVDIAPKGDYITVSGKLDPHATVYGFDRIKKAIDEKNYEGMDRYGIPILKYDAVVAGKVELGAGPLHTQYDNQGNAYTSLYLESAVAKWTLGEPYHPADKAFKLVDKVSIHYNVGHLATTQGDTMDPKGKYLVAMNKWSIDRHQNVGPLHPQNFQLIDISGEKMELLADMPIGFGEPHYAQIVSADTIKAHQVYEAGVSPASNQKSPNALASEKDARIEKRPGVVEVWMNVVRSRFTPDIVTAKVGDRVIIHLTNTEGTPDATHGFAVPTRNVMVSLDPGESTTVEFVADKPGSYSFYCTEFCSALHLEMQGWLIVEKSDRAMSTPHDETRMPDDAAHFRVAARVRRLGPALAFLAAAAIAGCGGGTAGPPEIVVDRTSCDHCRMLISDVRFAAAVQQPPAAAKTFDDIGCLLAAIRNHNAAGLTFWFRDANDGEWIPGAQAVFVSAAGIRTPMSGGITAYREAATAEQAATKEGGTVVPSMAELLASAKAGSGS